MKIKKLTIEDLPKLRFREEWIVQRYVDYLSTEQFAWMLEDDNGLPVCAFGAAMMWKGVGEVWFVLINKVETLKMIRFCRRFLREQMKINKVWRLFATVDVGNERAIRFVEWMGFERETPNGMKCYKPDKSDCYLYARVIQWN